MEIFYSSKTLLKLAGKGGVHPPWIRHCPLLTAEFFNQATEMRNNIARRFALESLGSKIAKSYRRMYKMTCTME